ncbi:MAG TPA: branched-chain amino acid ABC transporter permease [bacterium]|nr:branched-chain amino acid ABC transporter permease [bacterium]
MSTIVLLGITGLGLGGLYFLMASGLSLTYGLLRVLNFAHGVFLTAGAYTAWLIVSRMGGTGPTRFAVAVLGALVVGAAIAAAVEVTLIRPLYRRHIEQVLATVGVALALGALAQGIFGADPRPVPVPPWMQGVTSVLGAAVPNSRLVTIAAGAVVLGALGAFLRLTRWGLIVRAGVENREMVQALGIDVQRAFTLVFALGGVAAALGGVLSDGYFGTVDPARGTAMLIYAFVVVVIGGLGSIAGSAIAAVLVGLIQQFANYYGSVWWSFPSSGDLAVVLLLVAVLLVRPRGLAGGV